MTLHEAITAAGLLSRPDLWTIVVSEPERGTAPLVACPVCSAVVSDQPEHIRIHVEWHQHQMMRL